MWENLTLRLPWRIISIAVVSAWNTIGSSPPLVSTLDLGTSFSCLFVLSCYNTPWYSMKRTFQSMINSALDRVQAARIRVPGSLSSISSLLCNTSTWSEISYLKAESSISPVMGYRKKKKFSPGRSQKGHCLVFPDRFSVILNTNVLLGGEITVLLRIIGIAVAVLPSSWAGLWAPNVPWLLSFGTTDDQKHTASS